MLKTNRERLVMQSVQGKIHSPMMGSGIGSPTSFSGDYYITTGDKEEMKKYGIDKLRFGDLVLLRDCDNTYGRQFLKGSVTIGVIVHSNCIVAGHGPGVTGLLSCKTPKLKGVKTESANIANYLDVK